jgi:hypothetical protein
MSDGFVYFIQEEESGNIKIGFSEKHPKGRLKDFQTGNSNKLTLVGYIEGTYKDESNLHKEFSKERIRKGNEWFESSPRLKERIKELLEESLEDKKDRIEVLKQENKDIVEVENKDNKYNDSKYNGYVKETFPDGRKYEGNLKNGLPHGQGTEIIPKDGHWGESKYIGEFKNGERDGYGIEFFPNQLGERFDVLSHLSTNEGNNKIFRGKPIQNYLSMKYEGEFKDGKRNGQGTLYRPHRKPEKIIIMYVGGWKDGEYNGQGKLTLGKCTYEGNFKDGLLNGQGTTTSPNGIKSVGEFKDGSMWNGTYYSSNGDTFYTYVDGSRRLNLPKGNFKV